MSTYAILGMGRFGRAVAETLAENGQEVLIVDRSPDLVNQAAPFAEQALIADLSDEDSVKELGLSNMDAVIVGMAMELETSILCVMVAKEAGVPMVIAKARNRRMGDILLKCGADKIIYPEEETGIRLAKTMLSNDFIDYIGLSEDFGLVQMRAKKEWVGKNLKELNLRKNYNINVIAMKNNDETFNYLINPDQPLESSTVLYVVADSEGLQKIR